MQQVHVANRAAWRRWLAKNHARASEGIWLVFDKKGCGGPVLGYEESVEEALCYGWIDGTIRSLDSECYCRRFTPRRPGSRWSPTNRSRAARMISESRMTAHGLAKIDAAKRSGSWDDDRRPDVSRAAPADLERALARNRRARAFFETLAPSYRRQFIGWIATARTPETRARRVAESLRLLGAGRKLGLR